MFERFKAHFRLDSSPAARLGNADLPTGVADLLAEFGGSSFEGGLYRVMRADESSEWTSRVIYAFPAFKGRVTAFGYDWLGRVFAIDEGRLEGGKPGVVMFEPGTGEALEIPANIESFHEDELINFSDAALAMGFYKEWRNTARVELKYGQCVGYKRPLFLGGEDGLGNLEVCDVDVYWHVQGQLIPK
jgi:hypothetical protein